jgi:hypothetical protein
MHESGVGDPHSDLGSGRGPAAGQMIQDTITIEQPDDTRSSIRVTPRSRGVTPPNS